MKKIVGFLAFCAASIVAAQFAVSCGKESGQDESLKLPDYLTVSGAGIENGTAGKRMVPVGDGIWDIYAEFTASQTVKVSGPGEFADFATVSIPPAKAGVCRLRVNGADGSCELVKINKVSLVVTEGGGSPIEAVYAGDGTWTVEGLLVANDYLKYRYDLDTDVPSLLKYWCATWDNAGSAPSAHSAEYLKVRALGEDEYKALYLKEDRACWMFPADKIKQLASFTVSMNAAVPGQEIAYTSPHKGPKAIFIGDSITWQWARASRTDAASNLVIPLDPLPSFMTKSGDNYITRFHPEFFTKNGYINKGVSGQNSLQMKDRYKADVLDLDPHIVVIMAGTNDLAQGYAKDKIVETLASMAELSEAAGSKIVMCSVTPCNETYSRLSNPNTKGAHIVELNKMIKAYADKKGFTWCDYYPSLVASDGYSLKEEYCLYDRLHPNPDAYTVMEGIIKPIIDSLIQ